MSEKTAGTHDIPIVINPHAMWGPPVSFKHLSIVLLGMLVSVVSTVCSMSPPLTQLLTKPNKYMATMTKTLGFRSLSSWSEEKIIKSAKS